MDITKEDKEDKENDITANLNRRKAIVSEDEINLILSGRVKKFSIDINDINTTSGKRLSTCLIESESNFNHLLSELNGTIYDIHGRPELDDLIINYKIDIITEKKNNDNDSISSKGSKSSKKKSKKKIKSNINNDISSNNSSFKTAKSNKNDNEDYELIPISLREKILLMDIHIIFDSKKELFIISPKCEDILMLKLKYLPINNELIIKKSICSFGRYEFNTINNIEHKLWRRFLREYITPLIKDKEIYELMEERIYSMTSHKTTLYIDDYVNDDDYSDTTSISTTNSTAIHKKRQPKLKLMKHNIKPTSPIDITLSPIHNDNNNNNNNKTIKKKKIQTNKSKSSNIKKIN